MVHENVGRFYVIIKLALFCFPCGLSYIFSLIFICIGFVMLLLFTWVQSFCHVLTTFWVIKLYYALFFVFLVAFYLDMFSRNVVDS